MKRVPLWQDGEDRVSLDLACEGIPPLTARRKPWMNAVLRDRGLPDLVDSHRSPLNMVSTTPMFQNIQRLNKVAGARSVDFQIFYARKANKCLSLVDAALESGTGVDVASENELRQTIERGVPGHQMICTAAIKDGALIRCCLEQDVVIAVDHLDELNAIHSVVDGRRARIAIRLSGFWHQGEKLFSRFGVDVDEVSGFVSKLRPTKVNVVGLHFHLDGGAGDQRVSAIGQSLPWVDRLRKLGHDLTFLDIGGGFPVSYLRDPTQWNEFQSSLRSALLQGRSPITYQNRGLGRIAAGDTTVGKLNSYPIFQAQVADDWLADILDCLVGGETVAETLRQQRLQLRCEPGRALLDGCGMTFARVEFRKRNSQGDGLIGLAMNRTQCRTLDDDFLVDPVLIPCGQRTQDDFEEPFEGYLVGAYCTEAELITWRRLRFPWGVRRGDLVGFPNTAGYLMHFMESRSHQFPLAQNVVVCAQEPGHYQLDPIDQSE